MTILARFSTPSNADFLRQEHRKQFFRKFFYTTALLFLSAMVGLALRLLIDALHGIRYPLALWLAVYLPLLVCAGILFVMFHVER